MIDGGRRSCALVALAALVAHLTALAGGLVWLDHAHLEEGLALAPLGRAATLFTQGFAGTGFYRPLMALSLSLDAALGGAPWLYHAVTLLWHAAAAALVVPAARVLGLSGRAATLAGVLFAVHPATSLVAGAIAFRSEAMIAVALLLLVIFHRRGRPLLAALALLGGALAKETALLLAPLAILALELLDRSPGPPARRRLLVASEAAALALAVLLRLAFAPTWRASFAALPAGAAIGTRLAALARSALLAVAPVDRSICDATAIAPLGSASALVGAAVLAAVLWGAWRRRGPALLLALALLPALNLVPIMRWWSPHYLYVPLAFATMLGAEALHVRWPRLAWPGALALAGFLALLALRDDRRFRDDEALWQGEVAARPQCREGHFYLAEVARERRQLGSAVAHYRRAIEGDPGWLSYVDRSAALQNLGVTHLEEGRFADAAAVFRAALSLVGDELERRRLTHNLATAELRAGNAAETARLLEGEAARADAFPQSLLLRARALQVLGDSRAAAELLERIPRPSAGPVSGAGPP